MLHEKAGRDVVKTSGAPRLYEDSSIPRWHPLFKEWVLSAKDFGTTIVLTATKAEILAVADSFYEEVRRDTQIYRSEYFAYDTIVDPTYPFTMETEIFNYINSCVIENSCVPMFENVKDVGNGRTFATREEMTGFWVFGEKEHLVPYINHLNLYP